MGLKLIPNTLSKDNITNIQYNFDRLGPTDIDYSESSIKIDDIEYKIIKKYNTIEDVDSTYSSLLVLDKNVPVYYKFNAIYICNATTTSLSIPVNTLVDSVNIYTYYIIAHFNSIIDDKVYIIKGITFNNSIYKSKNIFINALNPEMPVVSGLQNLNIDISNAITINNRSRFTELIDTNTYYIYNNNKNKIIYFMNPINVGLRIGNNQISNSTNYTIDTGLLSVVPIANTLEAVNIQKGGNSIIKNANMPIFNSTGNNDLYIECGSPIINPTNRSSLPKSNKSNKDSKVFTIIIVLLVIIGIVTHLTMIIDKPNYIITRNVEIFVLFFLMFFPLTIF